MSLDINIKAALSAAVLGALCTSSALAEEATALDTIIVTGQKLERSVQDTKESVAVFTSEGLQERNLNDITDVFQQTPGVSGNRFGFRIRGIRSSDGAGLPNRGDLASVVVDGVTTSGYVKSEGVGQLWDVSQVEVLRGSQSTNLGRNALAGAIVINSNDPVYANEGKVQVGAGNHNSREYKGVANIKLIDGVSALRFSAENTETGGYINNITRNEDDYGASSHEVYRMKWLFEPSDALRMVLAYQHLESKYGDSRTLLGPHKKEDRISTNNEDAIFDTTADLVSLNLDYKMADNWSLKSITAYQDSQRDRLSDTDQSPNGFGSGGGVVTRDTEDDNWSQELRFNFGSENVRSSSGAYFTKIKARHNGQLDSDIDLVTQFNNFAASQGLPPTLGTLLTNPIDLSQFFGPGAPTLPAQYPSFYRTAQSGDTNVDTTSWAAFTEWEVDFKEDWTANFGVRYDRETQDYSTVSVVTSPSALPNPLPAPLGTTAIPGVGITLNSVINTANTQLSGFTRNVPYTESSKDFDNILPHAGITYRWNEDVNSSFFIKKSYRSGGSELTLLNGVNDFSEEELLSYELANRAIIFDGRGLFNANIYYSDWKDQQVAVQEPGTTNAAFTMTDNAGDSSLYGAELSFEYDLLDDLMLYVGGAVSETEYKKFVSADGKQNFSGNEFRFAPKHTAVTGLSYKNLSGIFLNTSVNYAGKSFSDVANTKRLDARTLVNINGGYEYKNLRLEAYVNNVFDKTYVTNSDLAASDGTPAVRIGAPRLIGARVAYSF